tara:strand:- start:18 stop:533 length:516 start_codon:yes stop_codon:yes gene_type:complete
MSILKVNSILPVAGAPTGGGGGIIQIKRSTKTGTQSFSSQGYSETPTDITDLSVSITPTSSSSKVFVIVEIGCFGSTGNAAMNFRIYRGSTLITPGGGGDNRHAAVCFYNANNTSMGVPASMNVLDSPSTTSATTYKVTGFTNAGTMYINRLPGDSAWNSESRITVMEVSA